MSNRAKQCLRRVAMLFYEVSRSSQSAKTNLLRLDNKRHLVKKVWETDWLVSDEQEKVRQYSRA